MGTVHIMLGSPDEQKAWPPKNQKDYYIGVDRGALYLAEKGYKSDLVIGDFDSISDIEKHEIKKYAEEIIEVDPDKDDTDAELSLVYAMRLFEPEKVVIYGWSGGRLDHLMSTLMIPLQPRFKNILPKIEFINKTNKICYFLPGSYVIHKDQNKTYCSVIGMTPLEQLSLNEGFKYQLNKVDYSYPAALVSNEFVTDTAELTFDSGIIAFIQSKD
ncbi:thiamine diphosphokinase [Alkalibacterium sp.]|nr:MAG: thiamine diphosphokinase [Alkalibacterium sp.]